MVPAAPDERQLGDVLDVGDLEGALVVLGQVPGILTSEGGSSICGCTGSDRELANEGAVVASRDLRLNHGVGGVELKTVQSVLTLSVGLQCVRGAFRVSAISIGGRQRIRTVRAIELKRSLRF